MGGPRTIPLDAVRTDGWFERIGESIGSFQALCEIVGERFFAFSLVAGVRITALTVDRRTPDATIVEFVAGEDDKSSRRASLPEFRRQLVGALLTYEPNGPLPSRDTDVDAIQAHIGIRYLLLAPLFGLSLRTLICDDGGRSSIKLLRDGFEETLPLDELRSGLGSLVRAELDRVSGASRGAIDLSRVAEAESAALKNDWTKVITLLGSWPAPLAIFLRTPEGQMLSPDARILIAKGLGLLGTACVHLGEAPQAEEILRLGIQYAGDSTLAGDLYRRLGAAYLGDERPAESIAPLRRALSFGVAEAEVMPLLARAFARRERWVSALGCLRRAIAAGVAPADLQQEQHSIEKALGPALTRWQAVIVSR